jgi:hypothetical protein
VIRIAALVSVAAFALYASMAARDVMFGDGLEFVIAAARNGVAHPPGYPLWIVLAHLATLVPLGTLAFRVNLTAALYHAVAVGLVYASGYVLTRRHLPALFAAVVLGMGSPLWLSWSLQAEAFSLNDAFAAAVVLLCLLWLDGPARYRLAIPLALLFGIGLSNHQTLLFLAPLPLWAAWCGRRELRAAPGLVRMLLACAALFIAGFWLPYVHTILASQHPAAWEFGEAPNFGGLLAVIERRAYGTFSLVSAQTEQGGSFGERAWLLIALGGWPYLAAAFGAIWLALRKRYRELVLAALTVAGPLVFFCAFASFNLDTEIARGVYARFGLLPLVAIAPFAACVLSLLDYALRDRRAQTFAQATILGVATIAFGLGLPGYSLADAHDLRALATDMYAPLPPRTIVLTASEAVELIPSYFQGLENWRPDVTGVSYGYLTDETYRAAIGNAISVPPVAGYAMEPGQRRDLLVRANPTRPFFVVGDRAIHAPGPLTQPLVEGVVSRMIPLEARIAVLGHYKHESALQMRPGYGAVSDDFWKTNGYAQEARAFYAGGFFSTGIDAKQLGDRKAARYWFLRAKAYSSDPLIDRELQTL